MDFGAWFIGVMTLALVEVAVFIVFGKQIKAKLLDYWTRP